MKTQVNIAARPLAPIAPQQPKLVPIAVANMPIAPASLPANGKPAKGSKAQAVKQQSQAPAQSTSQQQQQQQQQARPFLINSNGGVIFANLNNGGGTNGQAPNGQSQLIQPFFSSGKPGSHSTSTNGNVACMNGAMPQGANTNNQPMYQIVPIKSSAMGAMGMQMGMHSNGAQIIVPFQMLANSMQQQQQQQHQPNSNIQPQQQAQPNGHKPSNVPVAQTNGAPGIPTSQNTSSSSAAAVANSNDMAQQQNFQNLLNLQKLLQAQSQQQQQQQQHQQSHQQPIFINPFQQNGQLNSFLQQHGAQNQQQQIMLNQMPQNIMSMLQQTGKPNPANMMALNGNQATASFANNGTAVQVKQEDGGKAKKPVKPKDPTVSKPASGESPKKQNGSPSKMADGQKVHAAKNGESHGEPQMDVDGNDQTIDMETSTLTSSGTKKRGRPRLYEINPINGKSIKGKFLNEQKSSPSSLNQPSQPVVPQQPNGVIPTAPNPAHPVPAASNVFSQNLLNAIYPSPSPTSSSASSSSSSSSSTSSSSHSSLIPPGVGLIAPQGKVPIAKLPEKHGNDPNGGGPRALRPIKAKQDGPLTNACLSNGQLNTSNGPVSDKMKNGSFSERQNDASPNKRRSESKIMDELNGGAYEPNSDGEQQKENKNNSSSNGLLMSPRKSSPNKSSKRAKEEDDTPEHANKGSLKAKVQRLSPHTMKSSQVVLTHVIDGYVIKESAKPFPVKPLPLSEGPLFSNATGNEEDAAGAGPVSGEIETEQPYSSTPKKGAVESMSPSKTSKSPKKQSHNDSYAELMDCSMTSTKSCSKSSKHKCRHRHHKHHHKHSRSKHEESYNDTTPAPQPSNTNESVSSKSKSKSTRPDGTPGSKSSKKSKSKSNTDNGQDEPQLPIFTTNSVNHQAPSTVRFISSNEAGDNGQAKMDAGNAHQFLSPQLNPFMVFNSQLSNQQQSNSCISSSPTTVGQYNGGFQMHATVSPLVPADQQLPTGDPAEWNCDEVYQFVKCVAGIQIAQLFKSQEVDGSALTLIRDDHLVNTMQIKLGPALKIMSKFNELKEKFNKLK